MMTIIAGTNRPDSRTLTVAKQYLKLLRDKNQEVQLFSLMEVKSVMRDEDFVALEEKYLIPTDKFLFVMPEYNGTFPGILKLMMDMSDVRKCWWYKKAMLTGLADGRGGNLRGLEHMTSILNYLRVNVLYNKIPLSKITEELDLEGQFKTEITKSAIAQQIQEFIDY